MTIQPTYGLRDVTAACAPQYDCGNFDPTDICDDVPIPTKSPNPRRSGINQQHARTFPQRLAGREQSALARKTALAWGKGSFFHTTIPSHKFIRQGAGLFFLRTCEENLVEWVELLRKTTWPANKVVSDDFVISAFRALESAITKKDYPPVIPRFAYVQLVNFFECLEKKIDIARHQSLFPSESGKGNATKAIELYLQAHEGAGRSPSGLRRILKKQKRIGNRWKGLTTPSTFLLLMYSDKAEAIV